MRESGKNAIVKLSTTKTDVTSESATIASGTTSLGGITYAAYQVASLANTCVLPDGPDTPITVTLAAGGGTAIPADISWKIDHANGKIIFNQALAASNTCTVNYSYSTTFVTISEATEWSFSEAVKELDVTAFGDEFEQKVPLQKSFSGSLTGFLDLNVFAAAQGATDNANVTAKAKIVYLKLYKNSAAASATNPYFVLPVLVSFDLKVPVAGKVEYTAKFMGVSGFAKLTS